MSLRLTNDDENSRGEREKEEACLSLLSTFYSLLSTSLFSEEMVTVHRRDTETQRRKLKFMDDTLNPILEDIYFVTF
ncbi:MAG: hypothetical protein AB1414_12945 [bacterium]